MRKIMIMLAMIVGLVMSMASESIACDDCSDVGAITNSYMTYEEMLEFDEMIYEIYLEEYCINECNECDSYYYKECMCNACYSDCIDCLSYDYEIFVIDYYDMIMDEYEEVLRGIIDNRLYPKVEIKICYF
jgi:hypothetical protein